MNKTLFLVTLLTTLSIYTDNDHEKLNFDTNSGEEFKVNTPHTRAIDESNYRITISNSNVSSNPSTAGYSIDRSGNYILINNITPNPTNNNKPIIKITQSNVTLDLNKKTIFQIRNNGATGIVGIEIANGLRNISIINGTISDINGTGLKLGSSCSEINIEDLKVVNCSKIGLDFTSGGNVIELNNVHATGNNGSTGTEAVGIKCTNVINLIATKCYFNGNNSGSASKDGYGALLDACNGCKFDFCLFNTNEGQNGYGAHITNSSGSHKGTEFKDCRAIENTGTAGAGAGFFITASDTRFLTCRSSSNQGTSAGYGFRVIGENNIYEDCLAINNISTASGSTAYGFYSNNGQANIWLNCQAIGTQAGTGSSVGAGFYLGGTEKFSGLEKCKAQSNSGGSGKGYGVFLDGANHCSIVNSRLETNFGDDATNGGYGIKDETNPSTCMFFGNFAFGNGKSDQTIINNFDVSPTPDSSSPETFPSIQAFFNNYSNLNGQSPFFNIEVIENVAC